LAAISRGAGATGGACRALAACLRHQRSTSRSSKRQGPPPNRCPGSPRRNNRNTCLGCTSSSRATLVVSKSLALTGRSAPARVASGFLRMTGSVSRAFPNCPPKLDTCYQLLLVANARPHETFVPQLGAPAAAHLGRQRERAAPA